MYDKRENQDLATLQTIYHGSQEKRTQVGANTKDTNIQAGK